MVVSTGCGAQTPGFRLQCYLVPYDMTLRKLFFSFLQALISLCPPPPPPLQKGSAFPLPLQSCTRRTDFSSLQGSKKFHKQRTAFERPSAKDRSQPIPPLVLGQGRASQIYKILQALLMT